jgi:hypothetical protein
MRGMIVFRNSFEHFGHLKLIGYSCRELETFSWGRLLTQYSQKFAKQFSWLQVTGFQMMLLQIWQESRFRSTLEFVMRFRGMPHRRMPFSGQRSSFYDSSNPYFMFLLLEIIIKNYSINSINNIIYTLIYEDISF